MTGTQIVRAIDSPRLLINTFEKKGKTIRTVGICAKRMNMQFDRVTGFEKKTAYSVIPGKEHKD